MKRLLLTLVLVLPALARGQEDLSWLSKPTPVCSEGAVSKACKCGGVKTTTGYCCSGAAQAGQCLLMDDDAGTVAHVYWNGSALVDTKGLSWSMQGTVPQVAASGQTPPSAGPFSDANYYNLAAGSPLSFTGDFSICFVYIPPASYALYPELIANDSGATAGYEAYLMVTTGAVRLWNIKGTAGATTGNGSVAGAVNCACFGVSGSTVYAKLNLGTIASGGFGTYVAASGVATRIGRQVTGANRYFAGKIIEARASTTAASDALFISTMNQVKSRAGIVAWP